MESAYRAALACILLVLLLAGIWAAVSLVNIEYSLPCLGFMALFIVALLFYAAWGMVLGHSVGAWENYERKMHEIDKRKARKLCEERGVDPPQWTK